MNSYYFLSVLDFWGIVKLIKTKIMQEKYFQYNIIFTYFSIDIRRKQKISFYGTIINLSIEFTENVL